MSALGANAAIAAAILLSALSLLLLAVGLVSYARLRSTRLLWVSIAFLVMTVQGGFLTYFTFRDRGDISAGDGSLPTLAAVNLGIVLALYLAVLKR